MTAPREVTLDLTVNDRRRRVRVPPMKRLLDVLREECGLTGTKEGCGEGECGACTVLIDGRSVNSCLVPAVQAAGARILTVEGLANGARLNALQSAFTTMGAAQCGICTPGMLMTAHELLSRSRRVPGEDQVREALAGNLCRCTGYQKIVDAVRAAARASLKTRRPAARAKPAKKQSGPGPRRTAKPKRAKPTSARAVKRPAKPKRAQPTRTRAARRRRGTRPRRK